MEPRVACLLVALAAPVPCACSTFYPVQVTRFGEPLGPPRSVEHVEVCSQTPPRLFVEIARLSTESANYDSPGHAVSRLREIAAELGADAILVQERGTRVASPGLAGAPWDQDFGFTSADRAPGAASGGHSIASYAQAIAIRWADKGRRGRLPSEDAPPQTRPAERDEGAPSRPADAPFFTPR